MSVYVCSNTLKIDENMKGMKEIIMKEHPIIEEKLLIT